MAFLTFPEPVNDTSRKILHIDMDAFYASVEQRDNPALRGKPVVIARHPNETQGRGVVTTASYEARQYGIHSAMASKEAYELCPEAIFISARMTYYQEVSNQVRAIFARYTDLFEPVSIDEAYLDVTQNHRQLKSASMLAKEIQYTIWQELGLTCSVGVSYNKFLAKIASDFKKPKGLTVVTPDQAPAFLEDLPIERFFGVGEKTLIKMHELEIFNGHDLIQLSQESLTTHFGKLGMQLYLQVRGIDKRSVNPTRERKSLGRERTFNPPITDLDETKATLRQLAGKVSEMLQNKGLHGQVITIKVRSDKFLTTTKQTRLERFLLHQSEIYEQAILLFEDLEIDPISLRLLGITISSLKPVYYENIILPLEYDSNRQDS